MLPRRLKSLAPNPNTELKNKFTNGIVKPAPTEISIKGEIALKISNQSYDLCIKNKSSFLSGCCWLLSLIIRAKNMEPVPKIVMNQSVLCSFMINVHSPILKYPIQSRPLIITPENIVARDQVAALRDRASVLLSGVVLRMINGSEHTRISIIPKPQDKNANWISGTIW